MKEVLAYLKANWPLTIVLAVILVMVIILIVLLATEIARSKKRKANAEKATETEALPEPSEQPQAAAEPVAEQTEPAPEPSEQPQPAAEPVAEQTEPAAEPVAEQTESAPEPVPEQPQPAAAEDGEEKPPFIFVAVKEDKRQPDQKSKTNAPVAENQEEEMKQEKKPETKKPETKAAPAKKPEPKATPAKKPETKATPAKKPEPKAAPAKKEAAGATGKWVIENVKGKYWLSLIAPNGQVMLESPTAYASLSSAKSGIKTYQDNIAAGRLEITEHKNGDEQVQVLNARGGLLATSSTYSSRSQAESALASIKRWAATTVIVESGENDKK